jgi:tripartite ATP-independent transporter DctM subunit
METAGLWMLLAVAVLMISTGLPAWMLLVGVAMAFAAAGLATGTFTLALFSALPSRLLGLLETDILQALPLYVLMGAMLNRLPLAEILMRTGSRALAWTGCGPALAGLTLGVILAPMNGSVGAGVAMLSRTVQPKLDAAGLTPARSAALVCISSTLGVVIPPSLVLILLGDAMLRAHTEAINAAGGTMSGGARIINTQDVFHGALVPAALLLCMCIAGTWWMNRRLSPSSPGSRSNMAPAPSAGDWFTAAASLIIIVGLLSGVVAGYLYAVEAAATGGVALFLFGVATRTLNRTTLRAILRDTMMISGALFALLIGATVFTLVIRAFGTDRWLATFLGSIGGGTWSALAMVLLIIGLCALVLDAFEMIFVVIPLVIPPLLLRVPDATWVAVLTLLMLQASFLIPPFGYSVLMVRNRTPQHLDTGDLIKALLPFLAAQLVVFALVLAFPQLIWREAPNPQEQATPTEQPSEDALREMLNRQLNDGK